MFKKISLLALMITLSSCANQSYNSESNDSATKPESGVYKTYERPTPAANAPVKKIVKNPSKDAYYD